MKERYSVIHGAEAIYHKGNEIGVLVSHGFMGTPQSVEHLCKKLSEYGYTVAAPRLTGHGTHYYDLEKCTADDWFRSLEEAYLALKDQCTFVFVMGQSMGGALTLQLAGKYRDIAGAIVINAALSVPEYDSLREESGPRFLLEGEPDIKDKTAYEITYSKVPLHAIHQLQAIMERTPSLLSGVICPVLGIQSTDDHVVPAENTDYILEHVGSLEKEQLVLENSYHVASMDFDKDLIVECSCRFIQKQIKRHTQSEGQWVESV
ncbi:MAG: alpha/beta hydrolase [Bacillus sp. (in: firmicutes)]